MMETPNDVSETKGAALRQKPIARKQAWRPGPNRYAQMVFVEIRKMVEAYRICRR